MTDIWTDLSCWWYDRWMSHQIHLNHACDVTPPQSTVVGGGSSVGQKIFGLEYVLGVSR